MAKGVKYSIKIIVDATKFNEAMEKLNKSLEYKMGKSNLGELPKALQGFGANQPSEGEQLINEISTIAQVTPDEVEKFYDAHDYTLAFIKRMVLQGAELSQNSIEKTMVEDILLPRLLEDVDIMLKKTWKDYLSDIPFYTGYYIGYPFIWLAYWLWMGVVVAKEKVWG